MTVEQYYVVPDVHGRFDLLTKALDFIYDAQPAGGKIIFLGDYIDRGPDSYKVVQKLMNPPEKWQFICLMGNHEEMFIHAYLGRDMFYEIETLQNFIPEVTKYDYHYFLDQMPKGIIDWMMDLPLFHFENNNIFAHAWYDLDFPPEKQKQEILLWTRVRDAEPFRGDKYLIHGHTPKRFGPTEAMGRTNLDCGAVFYGRLVVAKMKKGVRGPVGYLEFKGDDYIY